MSKKQEPSVRVKVPLTKAQREKAHRIAKAEGRSLANWMQRLVTAALDAA